MKRLLRVIGYGLLPVLGLAWVIGCSTSSNPLGGGSTQWRIDLSVQPASVYADTGTGIVRCFLSFADTLVPGHVIHFRAASELSSQANITPTSWSSDTSATGMVPTVFYNPNDYAGDQDTIYAVFLSTNQLDTVTWSSQVVPIIH